MVEEDLHNLDILFSGFEAFWVEARKIKSEIAGGHHIFMLIVGLSF